MRDPQYQLRVSAELAQALKQAGPEAVRQALSATFNPTGQEAKKATPRKKTNGIPLVAQSDGIPPAQTLGIPKVEGNGIPADKAVERRLSIAEMVRANEAKIQAKKAYLSTANGLKP